MSLLAADLRELPGVREATVFAEILRPPGQPRPGQGIVAAFDLVLLVETESPDRAREVADLPALRTGSPGETAVIAGSNARMIGPVDHRRAGVFLFNFFSGPDPESTLEAWRHTAGWFQVETGLDNSTVILPDQQSDSPFTIVNHCRWDGLAQVLPALLFKRSFRRFVLARFAAAGVVPRPILYRMHR
jgi:hypothetical protein